MAPEAGRADHLEETGGNLRFMQALLEETGLGPDSSVLEIGCGTGVLASYIATCSGAKVLGTERSGELARLASHRIDCVYTPDGSLPNSDQGFDLIFCKDVLPLIANKVDFFTNIARLLRKNGTFSTYAPEERDFTEKPLYAFLPHSREQSQERYGTMTALLAALHVAGFKRIKTFRITLGNIPINTRYAGKHRDGFFSNTESVEFERSRLTGLHFLQQTVDLLADHGASLHYDWERTMVVAR